MCWSTYIIFTSLISSLLSTFKNKIDFFLYVYIPVLIWHLHLNYNYCKHVFCYCLFISRSVLPLEIQSSKREGKDWVLINWFYTATIVCLSQARTWTSYFICYGIFFSSLTDWVVERGCFFVVFFIHWWNFWPSLFKLSFRNLVITGSKRMAAKIQY